MLVGEPLLHCPKSAFKLLGEFDNRSRIRHSWVGGGVCSCAARAEGVH